MAITSVNGKTFQKMVTNGSINLKNNCEYINSLNVFPVPDGDTGINMSMTSDSGVVELNKCQSDSIIDLTKIFARGLLMGARGNSGVSLSQYFRGISVGVKSLQKNELSTDDFIYCMEQAKDVAYKAFKDPIEGTMLTVIRESYDAVKGKKFSSFEELFKTYYEAAKKSEANTINLLPVLKDAGVTDSGGEGFLKVVEGMYKALIGEILLVNKEEVQKDSSSYEYETSFYIVIDDCNQFQISDLRQDLAILGSIEIKQEANIITVKAFSDTVGKILAVSQKYGNLIQVVVKNNKFNDKLPAKKKITEKKEIAIVAVAFGDGIKDAFKELGVSVVINGGQTMNPSTEAFVDACKEANAKNIIIIPNNGNVILAAEQASKLVEGSNIKVLRAKTISQGYASLMVFDNSASIDDNLEEMMEAVSNVKTGEITYAVRDTSIGGVDIKANDFMGILDSNIIVSTKDRLVSTKKLLEKAVDDESAVVTIFKGKDINADECNQLVDFLKTINEDVECEIVDGKQDIYSYIISVE